VRGRSERTGFGAAARHVGHRRRRRIVAALAATAVLLGTAGIVTDLRPAPAQPDASFFSWGLAARTGTGSTTNVLFPAHVGDPDPDFADELGPIADVSTRFLAVAAVTTAGDLWVWGRRDGRVVGDTAGCPAPSATFQTLPVRMPNPLGAHLTRVAIDDRSGLAIDDQGDLWGWGDNLNGQLGLGTFDGCPHGLTPALAPVGASAAFHGYTKVVAASTASMAIGDDGHLYAWGGVTSAWRPDLGTVPAPPPSQRARPGLVRGGAMSDDLIFVSIASANSQAAAFYATDSLGRVWDFQPSTPPILVVTNPGTTECPTPHLVEYEPYLTFARIARDDQGRIYTSGPGFAQFLGRPVDAAHPDNVLCPVPDPYPGATFIDVAGSDTTSTGMALSSTGEVWAFGRGTNGEMGNGQLLPPGGSPGWPMTRPVFNAVATPLAHFTGIALSGGTMFAYTAPPPVLAMGQATISVAEGAGQLAVPVHVTGTPPIQPVTIQWTTHDGSAAVPGDYTTSGGTLTIAAGSTSGDITIPIVGDALVEPAESFTVDLAPATVTGALVDGTATTTAVTIVDDDLPALTHGGGATVSEAAGTVTLSLDLSQPSHNPVTVQWSTGDGTAVQPGDYTAVSAATATFPPGVTHQDLTVTIVDDTLVEPDEAFTVVLDPTSVSGASFEPTAASATVTISNDDTAPPPPPPPPPPGGLTLTVTAGSIMPKQGSLPSAVAARGTFALGAGTSLDCRTDTVTVTVGAITETVPGSRFVNLFGVCTYAAVPNATRYLALVTYRADGSAWAVAGTGTTPTFSPFANPVAVTLTIGNDTGSRSLTFVQHKVRGVTTWSYPK
jgi:hypothetical protein